MIKQTSIDLSQYRLEKAKDLVTQAKILHLNKKYDGSINRSYYAVFNAMRSLLALLKLDSSKHSGVLSYFDRYFVKTMIIEKKFSKIAHAAFEIRQDNDYEDFYQPSEEESEIQLQNCKDFIMQIESVREKLVKMEIMLPPLKMD